MPMVQNKSQPVRLAFAYVFLVALSAVVIFPFLVVISVSLRPGNFATGSLIPSTITFDHWRYAFGLPYQSANGALVTPELPVLRWMWNSLKIGLLSGAITVIFSTTGAYALARMRFKGRKHVLTGLMLMQMFPAVLALVAIYSIFDRIGTAFPAFGIDSHWAVLLAYSGGIAMHIWTIKGYYETIPYEIEEAAKVDGATPLQAFWMVLLPMALPILAVVFLLSFIGALIEYPVASVLLTQQNQLTLAVGTKLFVSEFKFQWGDFAAVAILSGLPITVMFVLVQKWMVAGLTAGGSKG